MAFAFGVLYPGYKSASETAMGPGSRGDRVDEMAVGVCEGGTSEGMV